MDFLKQPFYWTRKAKNVKIEKNKVEILTEPQTDLWQKTYYGFQNDTAPVLQVKTKEKYFSFIPESVKLVVL